MTISVAIVDNHPWTAHGIQAGLADAGGEFAVVGTFIDVEALLDSGITPDVVVLDLFLGNDDDVSIGWIPRLCALPSQVLLHTSKERPATVRAAMELGAAGLISKNAEIDALVDGVRAVAVGDFAWNSLLARTLLEDSTLTPRLTPRQVEVLDHLYDGCETKQVARRMGVALETVRQHLKDIRERYAASGNPVSNTTMLLRRAAEDGHLDHPRRPVPPPDLGMPD